LEGVPLLSRSPLFLIETKIEADNDKAMMTPQALPRVRKDHHTKKSSAKQERHEGEAKNALYAISEHSLFKIS
jgi:hypothetical protein